MEFRHSSISWPFAIYTILLVITNYMRCLSVVAVHELIQLFVAVYVLLHDCYMTATWLLHDRLLNDLSFVDLVDFSCYFLSLPGHHVINTRNNIWSTDTKVCHEYTKGFFKRSNILFLAYKKYMLIKITQSFRFKMGFPRHYLHWGYTGSGFSTFTC